MTNSIKQIKENLLIYCRSALRHSNFLFYCAFGLWRPHMFKLLMVTASPILYNDESSQVTPVPGPTDQR
jgi:hypothetical protein